MKSRLVSQPQTVSYSALEMHASEGTFPCGFLKGN